MQKPTPKRRSRTNRPTVLHGYDVAADSKNRINLRGAKTKYFRVNVLSDGCYLLEPRVLVSPDILPARTRKMLDRSAKPPRRGQASASGSFYERALPVLRKAWERNRNLPADLATHPKHLEGFGS